MVWIVTLLGSAVSIGIYVAILNKTFLRCPYCRKTGTWRFDDLADAVNEFDEDGSLMRSTQRQSCRKCGGQVDHVWSDHAGREIRGVDA